MARLIKSGDLADGGPQVLKLSELAADARAVVRDARSQAAELLRSARARARELCRQAHEAAVAEALPAAQAEARRQARQELDAELQRRLDEQSRQQGDEVAAAMACLAQAREEVVRSAERGMLEFAMDLAGRIVGRVCAADVSAAQTNLQKALELATAEGEVTVLAHPRQVEALRRCLGRREAGCGGQVRLLADEAVAPGGVRLLSRFGEIDATMQTQLARVAEALLGPADLFGEGQYVSEPAEQPARAARNV